MDGVDVAAGRFAGVGTALAGGVGVGMGQPLADHLRRVAQGDVAAGHAFGHGPWPLEAGHNRALCLKSLWFWKGLAKGVVEPASHFAGELDVRQLISAHRHRRRLVDQNVGRHEDGVGQQAKAGGAVAGLLVLVGRQLLELGHRHLGPQQPRQFDVLRDVGLHHENRALGVQARRQVLGSDVEHALGHQRRVVGHGDGVVVHHGVDAIVSLLQRQHPLDRTVIVAQVEAVTRGLDAGKDAVSFLFHGFTSCGLSFWIKKTPIPKGTGAFAPVVPPFLGRVSVWKNPQKVTPP